MNRTRPHRRRRAGSVLATVLACTVLAAAPVELGAQRRVTSPRQEFGFDIGDDWKLVDYTAYERYVRRLATESNRMRLVEIGRTAEGRPQLMAIISSPANLAKLERYREISRRLALARDLSDTRARALAREGRAVVWIDGGLHATEVLGAAQLIATIHQLVSSEDSETRRFLDDCIILAVHANPDGMELVSNWYMKDADTLARNLDIPRLYQKYVGHDNNRDFYAANQPETRNMNRVLFRDWMPQIVYNHHQTGPAGTVMFAPPFRDPFNYNYDPLVPVELDLVAAAMHSRFVAEGKPGVTMRTGSTYSTWWNGGLRTTPYFHNQIGLLTETIGSPTPMKIPFIPEQQLPRADLPFPIAPQTWHFRQSIEYSLTANRAVLDIASRERETLLYNIYRMGRNSIERGSRDSWTARPSEIEAARATIARDSASRAGKSDTARTTRATSAVGDPVFQFGRGADPKYFDELLRRPDRRDPRGYILPADQADFGTATKFINSLRYNGVTVHRAMADFRVGGRMYPAGSFVVKTAQAFRPHVMDMFEPQDHPNDFAWPGGPPKRPYDNAGWTLAYQMGVQFDRVLDDFSGPFEEIRDLASPLAGTVAAGSSPRSFLVGHAMNDAVVAVNRALRDGARVSMTTSPSSSDGTPIAPGTFVIEATPRTEATVRELARTHGVSSRGVGAVTGAGVPVRRPRIALLDMYGGSMPSGHIRWILEQFEFPYEIVYPRTLDAGGLAGRYDVVILPSGAFGARAEEGRRTPDSLKVPPDLRGRLGRVTVERTVPALRQFLEAGGRVIAIGTSASIGHAFALPVTDALLDSVSGRPLGADRFYVPGSILRVTVDTTRPVSFGMRRETDVFFDNSPVFRLTSDAAARGVRPIAWFEGPAPLRSGWAWGQKLLDGAVAALEAPVGKGTLYLFGPEITFRGQPHGTFQWLFNGIYGIDDPLTR